MPSKPYQPAREGGGDWRLSSKGGRVRRSQLPAPKVWRHVGDQKNMRELPRHKLQLEQQLYGSPSVSLLAWSGLPKPLGNSVSRAAAEFTKPAFSPHQPHAPNPCMRPPRTGHSVPPLARRSGAQAVNRAQDSPRSVSQPISIGARENERVFGTPMGMSLDDMMGTPNSMVLGTPTPSSGLSRANNLNTTSLDGYESDASQSEAEDELPIYPLYSICELIEHAPPGSLVALDIDDTLLMTRGTPSFLLTEEGLRAFQAHVHLRYSSWEQKNIACRKLQAAVKDKICVEPQTADIIRSLQASKCWVFGLTARYSDMESTTWNSLRAQGIDLEKTAPFPEGVSFVDDETTAEYRRGVIYCNNQNKGMVLQHFLENVVFAHHLAEKRGLLPPDSVKVIDDIPSDMVFVDDSYLHNVDVARCASVADELGMQVSCLHYVREQQPCPECDEDGNEKDEDIMASQIAAFLDDTVILTNEQAVQVLRKKRAAGL
jgi:hypothetical protein